MTAPLANMINALTLIACGVWGYWAGDFKSLTALIPVVFGVALLACQSGVKAENKVVAHIAVLLTLVILVALFMPLSSALGSGDAARILRSLLMVATGVLVLVFFIKSFIDARRARQGG
ncbi:MAG: hypothetical protein AAF601_11330 [Pseudomonadota bacterium]